MGYLTDARAAIIAKAAGVAGAKGASARPLDNAPPSTPWYTLSSSNGTVVPGNRERTSVRFTLRLWLDRMPDDNTVLQLADDYINLTIAAYRSGITLAGVGGAWGVSTTAVSVTGWSQDWKTVGSSVPDAGSAYLITDFELTLQYTTPADYTA